MSGGFCKIKQKRGDYKLNKKYMLLLLGILLFTFLISLVNVYAVTMPKDPGYNPDNLTNPDVKAKADSVMGTFVFLVQVACIATMVIMGLRYMFASAEAKADLKKSLLTWCVGAVFVFCASTIVGLILNVVTGEEYISIKPVEDVENNENTAEGENERDYSTEYWNAAMEANLIPSSIKSKPKADISRVEFAESVFLLANYLLPEEEFEIPENVDMSNQNESDKELSRTKKEKILKLYNADILTGEGKDIDGNLIFRSGDMITREDAATIMYRMLDKAGKTSGLEVDYNSNSYDNVSDYAKEAMACMNKLQFIVGDERGNLNPKGNISCRDAIIVLYRIYSKYCAEK